MIKTCTKCLMPNTRPRVVFNDNGVCNACINAEEKKEIDWGARKDELEKMISFYRNESAPYDCLVPWSGGKDSSMVAYRLKYDFGLNPLLVTTSPLIPNSVGEHNREEMRKAGFDSIFIRPNQKVARYLARRFFIERGNPKAAWDAGVTAATVRTAVAHKIPVMFFAEHGESEYGGRVLSEDHKRERDVAEFLEHLVGDDPNNWVDDMVSERDLHWYLYPDLDEVRDIGVRQFYFGYFFNWSIYDNYKFMANAIDFKLAEGGRTDGTFTNYDSLDDKIDDIYYYMQYIKFGFGRAVRDASRLIQLGVIDRKQALEYAHQYDGEFPSKYIDENLEYLGMTLGEFTDVVDKHRNLEIWEKSGGKWKLKFEIN